MPTPFLLAVALLSQPADDAVEPQPLPDAVEDTGINVLLDSGHQFSFFDHWNCQSALRDAGHRVTGNQASLHHALAPGTPMRVRDQRDHTWNTHRPFTTVPAPAFDVVLTYQHGEFQPYLEQERAALREFVRAGGGLIISVGSPAAPLADVAQEYGVRLLADPVDASLAGDEDVPGLPPDTFPRSMKAAEFSDAWTLLVGADGRRGCLAWRALERGVVVCLTDPQLLRLETEGRKRPNAELLAWMAMKAAKGPKTRDDGRRLPWEHGGIGGAFFPENEIEVGGVRVLYADNQLPDIVELARTRFTEVMDALQKLLPTPPNPGDAFYIDLAAGAGGGWAENAYTPKLAGTIMVDHDGILSVLAHELAHTMNGPGAADGTPGCRLPNWWSEAHAGWFQRKVGRELGFGQGWPYHSRALAREDPLLDSLDLASIPEGKMGLAWHKAWLIWSILDARYGEDWYPKWMAHIHTRYNDPGRALSMDDYIMSVSEVVGEDLSPLFERFGTTVGERTDLTPIAPPK